MAVTRLTTNGLTGTKYDIASADNYYMEPIATTLVGSGGTSTITFSNIPNTYKHLQIRTIARSNGSATNICLIFNGDTNNANYYARHLLYGDGTSALALSGQTLTGITTGSVSPNTTSLVAPNIIDLLDYSNSSKNKTLRSLGGYDANGSGFIILASGLWMNTAAINSINITCFSGSFTEHTRFSLYGIKG
jgi:hypothetical protein